MSAYLPTLKRVDLFEWTDETSPFTTEQLAGLHHMASELRSLQRICFFYTHLQSNELAVAFAVSRNLDEGRAGLVHIYKFKEGGTYISDRRRLEKNSEDWRNDILLT